MMNSFSIIVPIYNCETYLNRCVDSVIKQAEDNIELILINDGSIDKTKDLCEYY